MVSIDARLGAIKRDPVEMLDPDRIMALCREHDYWPEGDGKLEPVTLVGLFMRQIAVGNVSCDQVRLMGAMRSRRRGIVSRARVCRWP